MYQPRATIILDNGADHLKAGLAGDPKTRFSIPNCAAKMKGQIHMLVADEIDLVQNTANLQYSRPFDRGYLNHWDSEMHVWKRLLGDQKLKIEPEECQLIVTEAPFTPDPLVCYSTQVIFEEFGFAACAKMPAASLAAYHYASSSSSSSGNTRNEPDCVMVIDSGFSFTHVIPFYRGKAIKEAVKRINVGGKLLTNFLKETVSYRQWNMMDEFQLMNDAKEALCYVSLDFEAEMAKLRKPSYRKRGEVTERIKRNFVLPDFQTTMRGFVQEEGQQNATVDAGGTRGGTAEQQVLAMEVERFVVPEVLFRPSDVGLRQAGLAEAVVQSIEACDIGLRSSLYSNIVLTGGNMKFPGLSKRLHQEVRSMAPDYYHVDICCPEDPVEYAWLGGSKLGMNSGSRMGGGGAGNMVTKAQYEEWGAEVCLARAFKRW